MNDTLSREIEQLGLQPGQSRLLQVNGYNVEIRRPVEEPAEFADQAMLLPWVDFSSNGERFKVEVREGKLPLPDPPDIPRDYLEEEP